MNDKISINEVLCTTNKCEYNKWSYTVICSKETKFTKKIHEIFDTLGFEYIEKSHSVDILVCVVSRLDENMINHFDIYFNVFKEKKNFIITILSPAISMRKYSISLFRILLINSLL